MVWITYLANISGCDSLIKFHIYERLQIRYPHLDTLDRFAQEIASAIKYLPPWRLHEIIKCEYHSKNTQILRSFLILSQAIWRTISIKRAISLLQIEKDTLKVTTVIYLSGKKTFINQMLLFHKILITLCYVMLRYELSMSVSVYSIVFDFGINPT